MKQPPHFTTTDPSTFVSVSKQGSEPQCAYIISRVSRLVKNNIRKYNYCRQGVRKLVVGSRNGVTTNLSLQCKTCEHKCNSLRIKLHRYNKKRQTNTRVTKQDRQSYNRIAVQMSRTQKKTLKLRPIQYSLKS